MTNSAKALLGIGGITAVGLLIFMASPKPSDDSLTVGPSPTPIATTITAPAAASPAATPTSPETLTIGNADAPVTIVEYGDFQCPTCGRFFKQAGVQIREQYVKTGKAKIEFRVYPYIGPESVQAGQAAYCANDQGKFEAMHDELYRSQGEENSGAFSDDKLKAMSASLKLETGTFNACLDTGKYQAKVKAGLAEAKTQKITATPTIIIGTHRVVGAQAYATYKALIDAQL